MTIATTGASLAAVLYSLIGIGALKVGTAADGSSPDLLAFGAILGATFAGVALLLVRVQSRRLWASVAVLQLIVVVGYFAFAGVREPPVEAWGLLIKACQLVVLGAVGYLFITRKQTTTEVSR